MRRGLKCEQGIRVTKFIDAPRKALYSTIKDKTATALSKDFQAFIDFTSFITV